MPRNYSQSHRYHNPSFRSYTSLKQSKAIQKQNSRYDNKKTAESLEQRDNEIQLNQSIEIKSVKYAFGIICILCNSNLVLPAIATANSMQANKISAGAYHNEHNKVQEPCAVITHPFHFTATSCAGLDHAIIQDCLGAASNKMFQLMHPYLPTVKQECIVRKGLDTEQWNSNATAGDHRSTGNKGNNIITCEIRIREGYQNHPKVIQHELVHAFHNQYSPHGRGGWSRLFEELPQYIAVSDNKGLIPDSYCNAMFDFFLAGN
ncbi:hypothetical protein [Candidatus Tisiphia endosymbiont of Beris chalybata]|uniref:hypothetical protein n=1 Tax=Candidatus Tisiphia endosymbiont of Beris chalybata TaxID=3066262 RepID=UPI00312CB0DB